MSVVTPIAIYCSAQRSDAKGPGCVKNVFTQPGSRTAAPITGYRDQCSPDSCRPGAFVWATEMLGRYCPAWLGSASDIRLNFIAKRACGHATPTNGLKRPNRHFCSRSSWIFGRTRSDLANTSLGQTKHLIRSKVMANQVWQNSKSPSPPSLPTHVAVCQNPKSWRGSFAIGRVTACPVEIVPAETR